MAFLLRILLIHWKESRYFSIDFLGQLCNHLYLFFSSPSNDKSKIEIHLVFHTKTLSFLLKACKWNLQVKSYIFEENLWKINPFLRFFLTLSLKKINILRRWINLNSSYAAFKFLLELLIISHHLLRIYRCYPSYQQQTHWQVKNKWLLQPSSICSNIFQLYWFHWYLHTQL